MARGTQIVNSFVEEVNKLHGISISRTSISRNVFEFRGVSNSLLYIKGRAGKPYRWGVTANVIDRLYAQPTQWFAILLFDSHEKGYLLNLQDVDHYIQNVWPLGTDGDYKPATGSYLSRNAALISIDEFIEIINV